MKNYSNQDKILADKILQLEIKRRDDFNDLKSQLGITYDELRPSKLLKRTFNDIKQEPEIKGDVISSLLSLGGGYLSKRILIGRSNTIIKSLLGYAVQYFSTKIISKNIK
jgi:hypothetical protein